MILTFCHGYSRVLTENQSPAVSGDPPSVLKPEPATPGPMHEGESHPESPYSDHDDDSKSSSPTTSQQPPAPAQPEELKTSSATTAKGECLICENTSPQSFWFCGVCKLAYCDICWKMQAPHRVKWYPHRMGRRHWTSPIRLARCWHLPTIFDSGWSSIGRMRIRPGSALSDPMTRAHY